MNAIPIDSVLYTEAVSFAERHNVNLQTMVERYIRNLLVRDVKNQTKLQPVSALSSEVQSLIGVLPMSDGDIEDMNGTMYKQEALDERI